jgi:Zn-dependent M28 family amino/carboxypeptidase
MPMRIYVVTILVAISSCVHAQPLPGIPESDVNRIEKALSSDDMQGRKINTPGIEMAAAFIAKEFQEAGLKPLPGSVDYYQVFSMLDPESVETTASLDGEIIGSKKILAYTTDSSLSITPKDNYEKVYLKKGANLKEIFFKYMDGKRNLLILVDTSYSAKFERLAKNHLVQFSGSGNRIFLLTSTDPKQYLIRIKQKINYRRLRNIVGMIPGRSRPDEYVIFSAHYDHLGIGKPDAAGDSVFNGANDDASGTTAVIALAKYFSKLRNNDRTIIFTAFTAEETGEFGSAYFSLQLNPDKVMAMFNIEMIGTESKWGKNSAYITGYEKSDMGQILQKNLNKSWFKFYPDPYPEQMLFLRSDNATLAKVGVPAHTISTSKMDSEKFYHTRSDELGTLDISNMTEIIRAIGMSAHSIISGQDTPTRVHME